MKILVADDHLPTLRMLSARLRSWGFDPVLAANGSEAWEKLTAERLNLVMSDWMMPGIDGLELCRRIREAELDGYVYIILCTGKDDKAALIAGLEAGADDFISKPIDHDELRVALRAGTRVLELESKLMTRNNDLSEANVRLAQAYATMRQDLEAAAAVQGNLLPRDRTTLAGVGLDWLFLPAHLLAGDVFDFFCLDSHRLAFYHIDVAGHGVRSALLSVSLSRDLLNACREGMLISSDTGDMIPTEEVVSQLNQQYQDIEDMYFTMVYGFINTETNEVRMTQAGHPNPILISPDGTALSQSRGGFPVGLMTSAEYDSYSVSLEPGSRMVVYSDGITECRNSTGEPFGEDRLVGHLVDTRAMPVSESLAALRQRVRNWRGSDDFEDDISLLAFERH